MLTRLQALQNKEVARALGHLTFMGINCKRNHGAIRYTVDGACIECPQDKQPTHPGETKAKTQADG
ncbi:Uncharacterised protein [Edwardsiella hoshinae]|uniref:Uncharacterized protein n=1 Tax=Edwardsiella hoshinae TaxID=93378 RepID=A0A376IYL5_9GAMM|nr:Uncharacterised protein [Edwardsiella hoshinae]